MKVLKGQDEWRLMECALGHQFEIDAITEENLNYDRRIGLYGICPECGEDELGARVRQAAEDLEVSVESFNAASAFAVEHNLSLRAKNELAKLLEYTWLDGKQSEATMAFLKKIAELAR